ncbi:hypothetical protein [Ralstonia pseudosolanacearum]|uniref:hypothetical protein n=1 Tax=Ralstonia pseudosolanacearum TaxID=1310165 RepID=UPI003CF27A53
MPEICLAELERLALEATPQNFDSAELKRDGGVMECPICNGEGSVDVEVDYCNFDGRAIGVEFYGIGKEFGAAERYYRAARPAVILNLIARIRELEGSNSEHRPSAQEVAPAPEVVTEEQVASIQSPFNACCNREACRALLAGADLRHEADLVSASSTEATKVSQSVIDAVTRYGDARADGGDSATAIGDVVRLMRAALSSASARQHARQVGDVLGSDEDGLPIARYSFRGSDGMVGHSNGTWIRYGEIERRLATRHCQQEGTAAAEAARSEVRPIGWFDKELNTIRWRAGLLNGHLYDKQPFYTYLPVGAVQAELSGRELEDAARSAFETAMSFGVDLDVFKRLANDVQKSILTRAFSATVGAGDEEHAGSGAGQLVGK